MNRSRLGFLLLSLAVVAPLIGATLSIAATDQDEDGAKESLYKQLSVFTEVLSLIHRAYVEETAVEDLLAGALNGAADAMDPLATFVPAAEVDAYLEARTLGRSRSGVVLVQDRGISIAASVAPASPAAEAGIRSGDIIAEIEGRSTRLLPLWQLEGLLAGQPETSLAMKILHRGQSHDATLVLGEWTPPPPSLEDSGDAAILRLSHLDRTAVAAVAAHLAHLQEQGRDHLLLDLRGVAGGEPAAAYPMAELFVAGSLGELSTRDGTEAQFVSAAQPLWQGRMVVLVDRGSMGGSEILAEVLRQSAAATLVGEPSFGFAGRQALVPLSTGGRLVITNGFYSGPDGTPILEALVPEVRVSEPRSAGTDEPAGDPVLERGLEVLFEEAEPLEKAA